MSIGDWQTVAGFFATGLLGVVVWQVNRVVEQLKALNDAFTAFEAGSSQRFEDNERRIARLEESPVH